MQIDLNFLPLETSDLQLTISQRKYNGEKRSDGYFIAQLPVDNNEEYKDFILSKLQLESGHRSQIEYKKMTAKDFLESKLSRENMEALIPDDDPVFLNI